MKPRKVVVTLELETDLTLFELKSLDWWNNEIHSDEYPYLLASQVQANVIREKK